MKKLSAIFLTVILAVMMVVPASASMLGNDSVSYPDEFRIESGSYSVIQHYKENKDIYPDLAYYIFVADSETRLYRANEGFYAHYTGSNNGYKTIFSDGTIDKFVLSADGTYWEYSTTFETNNVSYFVPDKVVWASDSIFDIDDGSLVMAGDPNFPMPLWAEVERVTQGEMQTMVPILGGQMNTLVLCGVGCLALLMVLKLFGKRSLIFRS